MIDILMITVTPADERWGPVNNDFEREWNHGGLRASSPPGEERGAGTWDAGTASLPSDFRIDIYE